MIRMYDTNEDVLVARKSDYQNNNIGDGYFYVPKDECLCNAMVNFNMIDIVGRGIRKIFNQQWERRFPMPDYEIDAAKKEVAVRLYGNAINEKYTKLLKENKDLSLEDCILLDAVQKGHRLSESDLTNQVLSQLVIIYGLR